MAPSESRTTTELETVTGKFRSKCGFQAGSDSFVPGQPLHQRFEDFAPLLVISKLVEAGAGGREQHDISRLGTCACPLNGTVQRFGVNNLGRVFNLRFDLLCCCADGINALYSLAQKIVEDGIVASFIFSAENKIYVRGK